MARGVNPAYIHFNILRPDYCLIAKDETGNHYNYSMEERQLAAAESNTKELTPPCGKSEQIYPAILIYCR
jgi:hypothetical protein